MTGRTGVSPPSVLPFLALVLVLSAPLYLLGSRPLLPPSIPIVLPASAVMVAVPALAALALTWLASGPAAAGRFLAQIWDLRALRGRPLWIAAALLLMPAVMAAEWAILTLNGTPLPTVRLPVEHLPAFTVLFLAGAIGEELGWQGFAQPRLAARFGALRGALLLGGFWMLWHVIPFAQTGHPWGWVLWQTACLVPTRIVTAWLGANSGPGLLAVVLFHAMTNVAEFSFPELGSHLDPFVTFLLMNAIAATAVTLWGPTLADRRWRGED